MGQISILRFMRLADDRRQYDNAFQTRQLEAWLAALPTSSNMVDGDQSLEEPGIKSQGLRFYISFVTSKS